MFEMLMRLSRAVAPGRDEATHRARAETAGQFLRFAVVGFIGFLADTGVVYGLRRPLGLYGAGLASYFVASTITWYLNRTWTFAGRGHGPKHRQLALFMATNLIGFILNRGAYAALVTFVPLAAEQPVIATVGGALAGMTANFAVNRRLVFKEP